MSDAAMPGEYYHVTVNTFSQENLSVEKVLAEYLIPFRLRESFSISGYHVKAAQITRLKVRRTGQPVDTKKMMGEMDVSSMSGVFNSLLKIGAKANEGEDVTNELLARADEIVRAKGLAPSPRTFPWEDMDARKAFVVMSFHPDLADRYTAIQRVCTEFGLSVIRADKEISSAGVVERIESHLRTAAYVIADLTQARPNVYYEIGYYDAVLQARSESPEDHLLLVAKSHDETHFDLRHRGIEKCEDAFKLLETLETWLIARGLTKRRF